MPKHRRASMPYHQARVEVTLVRAAGEADEAATGPVTAVLAMNENAGSQPFGPLRRINDRIKAVSNVLAQNQCML